MVIRNWLVSVLDRIRYSRSRRIQTTVRQRRSELSNIPAMFEILEPRRVMSGIAVTDDSYNLQPQVGSPATVELDVLANDSVSSGAGSLSIASVTNPMYGYVTIDHASSSNGLTRDELELTPPVGFFGTESFNYTATDSLGETATATVWLTFASGSGSTASSGSSSGYGMTSGSGSSNGYGSMSSSSGSGSTSSSGSSSGYGMTGSSGSSSGYGSMSSSSGSGSASSSGSSSGYGMTSSSGSSSGYGSMSSTSGSGSTSSSGSSSGYGMTGSSGSSSGYGSMSSSSGSGSTSSSGSSSGFGSSDSSSGYGSMSSSSSSGSTSSSGSSSGSSTGYGSMSGSSGSSGYSSLPAVTKVSPGTETISGGDLLTITGTGFTNVTGVTIGGVSASGFTVVSPTSITLSAPTHSAGQVDVQVTTNAGTSMTTWADTLTYTAPPQVTSLMTNTGSATGGTSVTILGSNFNNVTSVWFGTQQATSFFVNSSNSITAVTPAESAGSVDVIVTTSAGTSSLTSADQFTFQHPPVLAVSDNYLESETLAQSPTPVVLDVLANDQTNSSAVSIVSVGNLACGTLTIQHADPNNSSSHDELVYTAQAGYVGTETFTYTIQDSWGSQSTVTDTLTSALPPEVSTLQLVHDTGLVGDGVTSDPQVQGTLTVPTSSGSGLSGYSGYLGLAADSVQINLNGATTDQTVGVNYDGTFDFNPANYNVQYGTVTIQARAVEAFSGGTVLYGDWQALTFDYEPNHPPVFGNSQYNFSVDDTAAAGTVIGAATAVDPDAGDTVSYSMTQSGVSAPLSIDSSTGQITYTGGGISSGQSFNITVTATDSAGAQTMASVHIDVTHANHGPVMSQSSYTFSLASDSSVGQELGIVLASDPDPHDTLTFSLGQNTSGPFAINKTTGKITYTGGRITTGQHYVLTVYAQDQLNATASATVGITVLAPGSTGTGNATLKAIGGVVGSSYMPSATAGFTPSFTSDGTTTSSQSGSLNEAVSSGNHNAVAAGKQGLTTNITRTGSLSSSWSYTENVTYTYDVTEGSGTTNSEHLYGGYTYIFTDSYVAALNQETVTFYLYMDDNYDNYSTTSDSTSTMTTHSWGTNSDTITTSHTGGSGLVAPSGSYSDTVSTSSGYSGSGTYSHGVSGGSVAGTMSNSGSSSDVATYTLYYAQDANGNWYASGGIASDVGGYGDSNTSSGSGSYTSPINGGTVSGTISENATTGDGMSYVSSGLYIEGQGWSMTGLGSASGGSSNFSSYSGSGSYTVTTTGTPISSTRSGNVTQNGSHSDGSKFTSKFALGANGWQITSASSSASGGSSDSSSYSGTGTYTRTLAGGAVAFGLSSGTGSSSGTSGSVLSQYASGSPSGTISGTSMDKGNNSSHSAYKLSSTLDVTSGNWSTTGSASGGGTSSSVSSSSGSGAYSRYANGGVINGTISENSNVNSGNSYTTVGSYSDATGWVTVGNASGSGGSGSGSSSNGSGTYTSNTTSTGNTANQYVSNVSGTQSEYSSQNTSNLSKATYSLVNGAWQTVSGTGSASQSQSSGWSYASDKGTYQNWGQNGNGYSFNVTGTITVSGGNSSKSGSSSQSKVVNGTWVQTSGSGSGSGSTNGQSNSSGSGSYTRTNPVFQSGASSTGSSITGTMSQSGGSSSKNSYKTKSSWVNGAWATSGTGSASGGSNTHVGYSGGTDYSWSNGMGSNTNTFSGHIDDLGNNDSGSTYSSKSTLSLGKWVLTSGTSSGSGNTNSTMDYSGTGTYSTSGVDAQFGKWGVSGTTMADGDMSDKSSWSGTSTVNAGVWVQTASKSTASGGSNYDSSYSGTGTYSYSDPSQTLPGTVSSNGSSGTSWKWSTVSTLGSGSGTGSTSSSGSNMKVTGSGSGSSYGNSSYNFNISSGTYTTAIAGGTISGKTTEFVAHNVISNQTYSVVWNSKSNQWDLTSGTGYSSDTVGVGSGYSGSGTYSLSGTLTDGSGNNTTTTFSGKQSEFMSEDGGAGSYSKSSVSNGQWTTTDSGGLAYFDFTQTGSSTGSGTYTNGAIHGSMKSSSNGSSTFNWHVYNSKTKGVTGDGLDTSSSSNSSSSSGTGTLTLNGATGTYNAKASSGSGQSWKVNYIYDDGQSALIAKDGGTAASSNYSTQQSSFSGSSSGSSMGSSSGSTNITYSFNQGTSTKNNDAWALNGGTWSETSANHGGSSNGGSSYSSSSSGSYVAKYGVIGSTLNTVKSSQSYNAKWNSSFDGTSWTNTGGGSQSGSGSTENKLSASGSYAGGAGIYTQSYDNKSANATLMTFTRKADGSWVANGSSSASGSLTDNYSNVLTTTATTAQNGGTVTATTSASDGQTFSNHYAATWKLSNSVWNDGSGSGSGSGKIWAGTSSTGTGSYSYQFDNGSGTVAGSINTSSVNKYQINYTQSYALTKGNWVTSESGTGSAIGSSSYSSSGSGTYSQNGGSTSSGSGGGKWSSSYSNHRDATIVESQTSNTSSYDYLSYNAGGWTETGSASGSSVADWKYTGHQSSSYSGSSTSSNSGGSNGGNSNTTTTNVTHGQSSFLNTWSNKYDAKSGMTSSSLSGSSSSSGWSSVTTDASGTASGSSHYTTPYYSDATSYSSSFVSHDYEKNGWSMSNVSQTKATGWSQVTSTSGMTHDWDHSYSISASGSSTQTYTTPSSGMGSGSGSSSSTSSSWSSSYSSPPNSGSTSYSWSWTNTTPARTSSGMSGSGGSGGTSGGGSSGGTSTIIQVVTVSLPGADNSQMINPNSLPGDVEITVSFAQPQVVNGAGSGGGGTTTTKSGGWDWNFDWWFEGKGGSRTQLINALADEGFTKPAGSAGAQQLDNAIANAEQNRDIAAGMLGDPNFLGLPGGITEDQLMAGVTIAASFVPGVGEVMDVATLFSTDPNTTIMDRAIAGGSLLLNVATAGAAPNFGGAAKAGRKIAAEAASHVDEAADLSKAARKGLANCPAGSNCFVAGTQVLVDVQSDSVTPIEETAPHQAPMEAGLSAVGAIGAGIALVAVKSSINGEKNDELKKRQPRKPRKPRGDGERRPQESELGGGALRGGEAGDVLTNDITLIHSLGIAKKSTPLRWLSNALSMMILFCFVVGGWHLSQVAVNSSGLAYSDSETPQFVAPPHLTNITKNIEDIQLGCRVIAHNPLREQTQPAAEIDPSTHRKIQLRMEQDGIEYELAFLRSLDWLDQQQAVVGGNIHLSMEEMGLDGPALVIAIDPCPEIDPDNGSERMVVTGTMKHLAANVLEVEIEGETEPLGVTDTHPIWSEDRQNFIVAGELTIGENLRKADGTLTQVTRITPKTGPPVIVYNLEIDGEHVYHVGGGILVHNACPRNYIVYQIYDKASGGVYTGIASAKKSLGLSNTQILKRRFSGGHHTGLSFNNAKVVWGGTSRKAARGLEDLLNAKQVWKGKSLNGNRPVSNRNKNKLNYLQAALGELQNVAKGAGF